MFEMEQTFVINHPYYPQHVVIPNYVPNATPLPILLGSFGTTIAIVVYTSLTLAKKYNPRLRLGDQAIFCWFVLCWFFFRFLFYLLSFLL